MATTDTDEATPSYRTAHRNVEEALGKASEHPCVDCGGHAQEWSYNHASEDELYATDFANLGAPYSANVFDYQPRCVACHRKHDRAHQRKNEDDSVSAKGVGHWWPEINWQIRQMYRNRRGLPDDPVTDLLELLEWFIEPQEPGTREAVALWAASTHLAANGVGEVHPRLAIIAPTRGAGKTTLLRMVNALSHGDEPVIGGTITDALIPRIIKETGFTTLCFDEADKSLRPRNVGATAILNSGWQRGAEHRINTQVSGNDWTPERVPIFAAVAFSGNGVDLADDTRERTIYARLTRTEGTPEFREADMAGTLSRLKARLMKWAKRVAKDRRVKRPPIPEGLSGRDRDRWSILLSAAWGTAGANPRGGPWVEAAERLALADRDARNAESATSGPNEQVAYDLFAVWGEGETFVPTQTLCDRLAVHDPETWGMHSASGKPITARNLAWKLSQFYRVAPAQITHEGKQRRGFTVASMRRVWALVGMPNQNATSTGEVDPLMHP